MPLPEYVPFNAENPNAFDDGLLASELDSAIDEVRADIMRRPGLSKSRSVTLKMTFTPTDAKGNTSVAYQINSALPAFASTGARHLIHTGNGELSFSKQVKEEPASNVIEAPTRAASGQ